MLDPELNNLPENVKNIHLISACGSAMGALSVMLKNEGFCVTGSDSGIYPPMSTFLENRDIKLKEFNPENINKDIDLVVIGNAVTKDNPEVLEVLQKKVHYLSMPQAINLFFAENKKVIMVTGTHGKTTTTGLISWILESAGLDPSFFIGGIHKNFDSGFKKGSKEYFVIEGDEYDTAFFDKESKFHHFNPYRLVVTGIEFDHADIFESINQIQDSFSKLLKNTDSNSHIFAFDSSFYLDEVLSVVNRKNLFYYGKCSGSSFRYTDYNSDLNGISFKLKTPDFEKDVYIPMSGEHNIYNAIAAFAVCRSIGIESEKILTALFSYKGMKRRQELSGEVSGVKVIDDFAHHPTEVKLTVEGIKKRYQPKRLIAVFEPGTNTSMRNVFQKDYEDSFYYADTVCIKKPEKIVKVNESERFSHEKLKESLNNKGINAFLFNTTDEITDFIKNTAKKEDLVLVMSNKGFDNIHEKILEILSSR
ncbi:MAG: UDP-N-acetylmuramate--L-alanine ligase [Thermodesulfobacteriota bacterium]